MTVAELLRRISGQELIEWEAYERINGPLGPGRGDWNAANIASTVAATARSRKSKRIKLRDFLLKWERGDGAGNPAAMEATARDLASRLGGTWTEGVREGGEPAG